MGVDDKFTDSRIHLSKLGDKTGYKILFFFFFVNKIMALADRYTSSRCYDVCFPLSGDSHLRLCTDQTHQRHIWNSLQ